MTEEERRIGLDKALEEMRGLGARVETHTAMDTWKRIKRRVDSRLWWTVFCFNREGADFLHVVEQRYYMATREARAGFELFLNVPLPAGLCYVAHLKKEFMTPAQYAKIIAAAAGQPCEPDALEKQDMLIPACPDGHMTQLFDEISAMLTYLQKLENEAEAAKDPAPSPATD